jgi:DNA-binding NtrC family response regulator
MASVLVIAPDPNIESLVGELVMFAGHRPIYDVTVGAAGESIRRLRPDVALIDMSLPPAIVDACLEAAQEAHARAVLMSTTDTPAELATLTHADVPYFSLRRGAGPLGQILESAVAAGLARPEVLLPERT